MKKLLLVSLVTLGALTVKAQDKPADPPLTITGSVDAYYKYDLSGHNNIGTSFATDHNSISIGMVDLALKKKVGKASFVGEVSFGPRGQGQSIPAAGTESYHIQNLYVSYDATDKLNFTMGYMGTFIGYEVISPVANFNYSTSYLFTTGPFQNAGFKATYSFSPKASLMVGVFNDQWNVYTSASKVNTIGAQLFVSPVEGWTAYLNVLHGDNDTPTSGTVLDLTTSYQVTESFKLGLNAASYTATKGAGDGGYIGAAIYPQVAISPSFSIGLREEYFKLKDISVPGGKLEGNSVIGSTLTANIKSGPLTIIPEFRLDNQKFAGAFTDSKGVATKQASQFVLAAVYAF